MSSNRQSVRTVFSIFVNCKPRIPYHFGGFVSPRQRHHFLWLRISVWHGLPINWHSSVGNTSQSNKWKLRLVSYSRLQCWNEWPQHQHHFVREVATKRSAFRSSIVHRVVHFIQETNKKHECLGDDSIAEVWQILVRCTVHNLNASPLRRCTRRREWRARCAQVNLISV